MSSLSAVTDEDGHPLENADESGRRLCEYWGSIFQARVEGPRHHQYTDILRYVQKASDDIGWTIDRTELDELELTDVREDWAHSSFLTLTSICWKEEPFQNISLTVGGSSSPRPLTSMTMEELFDLRTRFAH